MVGPYRRTLTIGILILLFSAPAVAQEAINHPELEWKTIETEHFFVHFHEGTERTARATAKIAEEIYAPLTSLYNHEPDTKVSFVIKDYNDYSNGLVFLLEDAV